MLQICALFLGSGRVDHVIDLTDLRFLACMVVRFDVCYVGYDNVSYICNFDLCLLCAMCAGLCKWLDMMSTCYIVNNT